MAFEPEKITRQHVLDAVEKIEFEGIKLRASTGYDVIVNDKAYPPKEIMRHAHEQMNGDYEWYLGGGEDTNKYLKVLGFEVVSKKAGGEQAEDEEHSWFTIVAEYYQDLKDSGYARTTGPTYASNLQDEIDRLIKAGKIERREVESFKEGDLMKIDGLLKHNHGILTARQFFARKVGRRYWALGFNSDRGDLDSYKRNNNWHSLHYERTDPGKGAKIAFKEFDRIKEGDYIIIRGYGGNGDLTVHYAGKVKEKDEERKVLEFYRRKIPLYKGKAPKGVGAGNWHNTIVPITRHDDIRLLFCTEPVIHDHEVDHEFHKPIEQLKFDTMNLILYGPPGTGKTYATKAYALSLLQDGGPGRYDEFCGLREEAENDFLETWSKYKNSEQVEYVTFHQSFAYEDFVQGIRPDVTAGSLQFDRTDGIFKVISDRARANYERATSDHPLDSMSFIQVLNSFLNELLQDESQEIDIPMRSKGYSFAITKYQPDEGRIKFRKQSGGTGHDLLVKNLKGIYEGTFDYGIEGLGGYYYPLVDALKQHAETLNSSNEGEELKQFVLIIDEINRANISRVLGELITLLEPDKRLGQRDELMVKLPSGESFGVPPNLHIIGTMNTADKSIAHLDVALRRRFKFIPMYPDAEKAGTYQNLLERLNKEIEEAIGSEFTIGHSYFMTDDPLKEIMNGKVIPLMMEYFNHRTDQVVQILKSVGLALDEKVHFGIPHCTGQTVSTDEAE